MNRTFFVTSILAGLGGLATAILTTSCDTVCTAEARASVVVQVFDASSSGARTVSADAVWYEVTDPDGHTEVLRAECADERCTQWILGYERAGTFSIHAEVCDRVHEATVEVELDSDGCHVVTEWVSIHADASSCTIAAAQPPVEAPPSNQCTKEARPSAIILPVLDGGDVWIPHPTEQLWYEHQGERRAALCAEPASNGMCTWWVAGFEEAGDFRAGTESCGDENAIEYRVEMNDDGCHVQTQYLPVFIDTRGCVELARPGSSHPPPFRGPH